jgi:hypothetical protein
MAETSLGQLLLSEIFPPDVYRPGQPIDKGTAAKLFGSLANDHPDEYRETLHKATLFGREAARATGGGTFALRHLRTPPQAAARRALLREQLTDVLLNVPEGEQDAVIVSKLRALQATDKDDTVAELAAEGNPFADMLKGAGRGNPAAISRLVSSDLMYADNHGREIPVPVLNSYSHGLTPAEYVASTFGVRSGVVTAKVGIGMGGYAAKLLLAAAHRMVVTGEDADESLEAASANRGLPVETDDKDNLGALLAIPVGPYKRNTRLDAKTLAHIKKLGHDEIVVRSPLTSADPSGGVYARDVGYRERDRLPDIGESVGITAAGAISEPVSQSLLCLAEGTSVRMADMTVKSIEDVQAGDWVLGADTHGNTFPTCVLRTYDNGLRACVTTRYRCGTSAVELLLRSTTDHKALQVVVPLGKYVSAMASYPLVSPVGVDAGEVFAVVVRTLTTDVMAGGNADTSLARRCGVESVGELSTHDIEVDHPDHLFVLANGLIVSNSAKHKGGLAEDNKDELTGFALIDRLLNTPKEFREAATHTENDGRVEAIREAEQGGQYVKVGSSEFYVPPSRKLTVKIGDTVEAGDQLTDGIANPRMVVAHKGLGEGARQLTFSLRKAVGGASRRNVELIVRGLVDRVRVTDEFDEYSPDDVVPYNEVAAKWRSRADSTPTDTRFLSSGYLEQPVLHYSVGTRITPSVAATLQKHKIGQVIVNQAPPPFEPELVRATDLLRTDSDWMTRQIGTGLEKGLLESTHRGRVSDENATSFVPARARAVDFGSVGKVKLQPPKSSELPNLGY